MSKYCPIIKDKVTYMFCEDCDELKCRRSAPNNAQKIENIPPDNKESEQKGEERR